MSAWQPIETAPKDGTRILICWCGSIIIGWWGNGRYLGRKRGYEPAWTCGSDVILNPTHWQPLPPPPDTEPQP